MKLIDANEVKEWIEAFKVGRIAKSELLFALTQIPTIDAEPVKHGRWIMTLYTTTSKRADNIKQKVRVF